MSYDIEIATYNKPVTADIKTIVESEKSLILQGDLAGEEGNIVVMRQGPKGDTPLFTVDGPFHVEPEDLPKLLAEAVLVPKWLTQIHVTISAPKKYFSLAKKLSRHIAEKCKGAAYDAQEDALIWPKGKRKHFSAPPGEAKIRLVNLRWYLSENVDPKKTATNLLATLGRLCPEALPVRFGIFEPLQHKLEGGKDGEFIDECVKISEVEIGDMLFWKSQKPCFGGSISFPDKRDVALPKGAKRSVRLKMEFDGRALYADMRWREIVVKLFLEIAKTFGAFYGCAYVERNVIVNRGLFYGGNSEIYPIPPSKWWMGAPIAPTWMAWFGGDYPQMMEKLLSHDKVSKVENGIFINCGKEPMDIDCLRGVFPKLPFSVLAGPWWKKVLNALST